VECKVIEWSKSEWVDPRLDTGWQEADLDTNRTPLSCSVDRTVPKDSVREYESALRHVRSLNRIKMDGMIRV
jgi:hypothetical protein